MHPGDDDDIDRPVLEEEPEIVAPSPQPLDAATEALRKAAAARGVEYEPPAPRAAPVVDDPDDPVATAEAALARAAEAREYAKTDRRAAEREERAKVELARLKSGRSDLPADDDPTEDDPTEDDDDGPSRGVRRRL